MEVLDKAQAEIKDKTAGRVTLKYYEGGQQGDERDFVRKIKLGQLDGAAITSIGLAMIDESIRVLELPMLFQSAEEVDYVADKMWPYFQKKFEKKGFKLNDRGEVGWVYFMSKNKVESLADLKGQKLWMWGDDQLVGAMFKKLGLNGVPLGVPEVDAGLTSGKINGVLRLAGRGGRAAVVHEGQVHDLDADELRDRRDRRVDRVAEEDLGRGPEAVEDDRQGEREEAPQGHPQGERGREDDDDPQGHHGRPDPGRDGRRLHEERAGGLEGAHRQGLLEGRARHGPQVPRRVPREEGRQEPRRRRYDARLTGPARCIACDAGARCAYAVARLAAFAFSGPAIRRRCPPYHRAVSDKTTTSLAGRRG